jgi:LmbE family N-acetylglucosaminyl deacetylase
VRRFARTVLGAAVLASLAGSVLHAEAARAVVAPHALCMQVVAHQDDDLFFMNPDIDRTIAGGVPTVTVYMTAGQVTGDGKTPEEKAHNRQKGVLNAYASMAGLADGDDSSQAEWDSSAWSVGGKIVERYRLRERPTIQLVFLDLLDGKLDDLYGGTPHSTIVPAEQHNVSAPQQYSKADAVAVLRGIMSDLQPTVLRAQDSEPQRRRDYRRDHADHIAAARFARDAAASYTNPLHEVNYRDYNIVNVPINLDAGDAIRKNDILQIYARYDLRIKNNLANNATDEFAWTSRMYYRWSRSTHDRPSPPAWLVRVWVGRCTGRKVTSRRRRLTLR